jgi:hypothetical protein
MSSDTSATSLSNDVVTLDVAKMPKSCRLHVGDHYLKLGQPKMRMPLVWDFNTQLPFLEFLGYWLRKGYYDRYAVSIAAGKDLPELIPDCDYVAQLFSCHYKMRADKVVKFDSAMLKYVMIGLGFAQKKKNSTPPLPSWVIRLGFQCKRSFLRGYLTASAKLDMALIRFVRVDVVPTHQVLHQLFGDRLVYWIDETDIYIPKQSLQQFHEGIGFLSQHKMMELEKMIFVHKL